MEPTISHSIDVAADPGVVWALVSDLPRMGRFSPENLGGRWLHGATGPAVGVEFRGFNRNGAKLWWTTSRIVACEPGRLLTFDVRSPLTVRVARWSYVITPAPHGCVLTENWYRVGNWFVRRFLGPRVTGREDRPGYNVESIKHTLVAVKAHAESTRDGARARRTSTTNAP